ncbi:hypothetical protein QBC47DRAFT_424717 [Echria macrotheca]|uniref:Uncharacterized protein n=1 Tax=Echria macrotheca TaxID=438768 RepID=A0AAJ0B988_9PEZI|nr:hypothetical protein QBC47DRAFT_424717 [Echria macrotheca]
MNQHSGSATLPRGFRYSGHDGPKTPEPASQNDEARMPEIPSAPRPRLKLKRRVVSQLSAPTQQFLASVAAADLPIPSIEEPETEPRGFESDFEMGGITALTKHMQNEDRDMHLLQPRGRTFSPPKTPAPGFVPSLSPTRYPNWTIDSAISSSIESTPDYESSRPSTSRSTQTSASLFSRLSHATDDDHCTNSEVDTKERYVLSPDDDVGARGQVDAQKLRKAPWTKAMSDHLWSTFVLYLQDPKVTPIRMGKGCVPPHGVLLRVSREAKRSWKGSKALAKAAKPMEGRKSGSSTPTAESSGTFIQWPHTCAATRSHLRELCKIKAAAGSANHHILSRSPTPFSQAAAHHWNRRSTPGRTPSAFTTDMSMSLLISTSESMKPEGPLAQLTGSNPEPAETSGTSVLAGPALTTFEGEPSFAERRRLGSPGGARSYGPSSSGSLAAVLGLSGSPMPRRLTHTVGPRRTLQSPVRLSRSSTQKRRHTQSSEPRKRPSISSDLWTDPNARAAPAVEPSRSMEFSSTSSHRFGEWFIPRIPVEPMLSTSTSMPNVGGPLGTPDLPPPRLGSPFSATHNSSFSFPNRLHRAQHGGSVDLGMLGRPFATIQQPAEADASYTRPSLAGRLAYLDQRLKELHRRGRSESPL